MRLPLGNLTERKTRDNSVSDYRDLGWPRDGWRLLALAFNPPTGLLVAEFRPKEATLASEKLGHMVFIRALNDRRFRPVVLPGHEAVIDQIATSISEPEAICVTIRYIDDGDPSSVGSSFEGLYKIGLPDGGVRRLADLHVAGSAGSSRIWIDRLLSPSEANGHLYAIVGAERHLRVPKASKVLRWSPNRGSLGTHVSLGSPSTSLPRFQREVVK